MPDQPASSAERVAAHRARKKTEAEQNAAMKSYVDEQVAITRSQLEAGVLRDHDGHTLERSEKYAIFRWQGVQAGEIASL